MTKDLIEFLTARIEEDEARAHAAPSGGWWVEEVCEVPGNAEYLVTAPPPSPGTVRDDQGGPDDGVFIFCDERPDLARFAARFDPARALAECEAKRRIIERADFVYGHGPAVDHVRALDMTTGASGALRSVLKMLATVYEGHPDFRVEWLLEV